MLREFLHYKVRAVLQKIMQGDTVIADGAI